MRFGGHETFPIRTGWLSKGLRLLSESDELFKWDEVDDMLGVGRNMAKSIGYWLTVTGLSSRKSKNDPFEITSLGNLILNRDPYFEHSITWWVLHVNLTTQSDSAVAWSWFFNDFNLERFDRLTCMNELIRTFERNGHRIPSQRTIAREVACILQTYSMPFPFKIEDPEDATDCPFRRLRLLIHNKDTGYFERRFGSKNLPPELLGYVLGRMYENRDDDVVEIPFFEALTGTKGPGRILVLNAEGLTLLVNQAEDVLGKKTSRAYLLGGKRMIVTIMKSPEFWLNGYFDRVEKKYDDWKRIPPVH